MSILFTIVRISFGTMRRALVILAGFFVVAWIILFSQVMWICEGDQSWKSSPLPHCPLGKDVAAAQVISTLTSFSLSLAASDSISLSGCHHGFDIDCRSAPTHMDRGA